jgi:6-phosphofructokinase 1
MAKNIGIITPGGDSSGINACIRAIVRNAIYYRLKVFGVYNGYQGLIEGDIQPLNARSVSGIINHGGTMLKSTRCEQIKTRKGIGRAVKQLTNNKIDCLVIIGGDGSLRAGAELSKKGISVIGIPASIDNDIYGTDETIGFDTAMDVAVEAIDKIRDTATSFNRVFLVEIMGREHGFLALAVGLASGAEYILIPEIKYDLNKICDELNEAKEKGKTSEIIIFAEGAGNILEVTKSELSHFLGDVF